MLSFTIRTRRGSILESITHCLKFDSYMLRNSSGLFVERSELPMLSFPDTNDLQQIHDNIFLHKGYVSLFLAVLAVIK